jgi:germination protein M
MHRKENAMTRKGVKFFFVCLCFCFLVCTGGCQSETPDISQTDDDNYIKVYFVNEAGTKLIPESRKLSEEEDKQRIADDLIDWMMEDPEDSEHFVAIPSEVVINNVVARNNVANIDFAVGYESLIKEKDVMCRAAIVKTLVQIPEIDYIEFSIGGKTMMDSDNTPIGSLTADSFVFSELPMKEEK